MNRPIKTLVVATTLFLLSASTGFPEEGLTLREAERLALERNLGLQSAALKVQASEESIAEARGRLYDPQLAFTVATGEGRTLLNTLPPSLARERYLRWDLSLRQSFPSGAEAKVGLTNLRNDPFPPAGAYDPNWRSELRLSLAQPLLKGFGSDVVEEQIQLAVKGSEATAVGLRAQAATMLAQVRNAYSDLGSARRTVLFREASLALARTILEENRARVAVGVLPPVDLLEAEVGVSQREKELLDAKQRVDDQLDRLAELVGLLPPLQVSDAEVPLDNSVTDEEVDIATAFAGRPELQQAIKLQERFAVEATAADGRNRPALDLEVAYAQRGLSDDYGDDLDQTLSSEARNWEVGVNFSYPLGNRQAAGEALRKRALADAAKRDALQLRESIRREVRAAIRELQVGQSRLSVTQKGVELAEEKLKNLIKRREVGLATTRDVLEGEADLAKARADHSGARATLERAGTEYLRATGRLIEREGFSVVSVLAV